MADSGTHPILSEDEFAQALADLRIAGVTDRATASSAEMLLVEHDQALREARDEWQRRAKKV